MFIIKANLQSVGFDPGLERTIFAIFAFAKTLVDYTLVPTVGDVYNVMVKHNLPWGPFPQGGHLYLYPGRVHQPVAPWQFVCCVFVATR